jgi:hypothetical protein
MRLLLTAWNACFSSTPQTSANVVVAAMATAPMSGDRTNPDLYEALQLVCSEKPNAKRLGDWLRRHRDRRVDGLGIYQAEDDKTNKVRRWIVSCPGSAG